MIIDAIDQKESKKIVLIDQTFHFCENVEAVGRPGQKLSPSNDLAALR